MNKNIILIILCFSLLGCGSVSSSPKEIRKEIWNTSGIVYDALVKSMESRELLGDFEHNKFEAIYQKYIKDKATDLTKEEYDLLIYLEEMVGSNYMYMFHEYKNNEDTNKYWLERFEEERRIVSSILNK